MTLSKVPGASFSKPGSGAIPAFRLPHRETMAGKIQIQMIPLSLLASRPEFHNRNALLTLEQYLIYYNT